MKIMELLLVFTLFLVPTYSTADNKSLPDQKSYLCTSEHGVQISNTENGDHNTHEGVVYNKFVYTPGRGLRPFEADWYFLPICIYDQQGRLSLCVNKPPYWAGSFLLGADNNFALSGFNIDYKKKEKSYYWLVGKCDAVE